MENIFYNKAIRNIGIINCVLMALFICGFSLLYFGIEFPSGFEDLYIVGLFVFFLIPFFSSFITCCIAWHILTLQAFKNMSKEQTIQNIILAILTCIFTICLISSSMFLVSDNIDTTVLVYKVSIFAFLLYSIIRINELTIKKFIIVAMAYLFPVILVYTGFFCIYMLKNS